MGEQPNQRRLAAILAADIAGYSRLMNEDEEATVSAWQAARAGVIQPSIEEFSGRIVKHTGDGFLAEFPTVSEAVRCAVTMQHGFAGLNADIPDPRRMNFRMGINLGEITVDDDDIHGDGVNIALQYRGAWRGWRKHRASVSRRRSTTRFEKRSTVRSRTWANIT